MDPYDEYEFDSDDDAFLDESDFVSSTPTVSVSSSTASLRIDRNSDKGFSITSADFVTAVLPNTTADYSFDLPRLFPNESSGGTIHVFVLPYRRLQPHHVEWLVVSLDIKQPCIGLRTLFTDGMIAAVLMTTGTRCLLLRVDSKDGIPMDREGRRQAEEERNRLLSVMGKNERRGGDAKGNKERTYRRFQQEILQRQTRGLKDMTEEWYNKALELVLSNEDIAKVGWDIWFDALALYQFFGHKTGSAYDVSCLSMHREKREFMDLFGTLQDLYPDAPVKPKRERLDPGLSWFDPELDENQIRYAVMDVWAAYACAMAAGKALSQKELQRLEIPGNIGSSRVLSPNAIACLHSKQPPLSLPLIPDWKIAMCAAASVLARTIIAYGGNQFEGDIRTEQVVVSEDGKFKITNERYATRIRETDTVLIQTKSGEVLKGQAIRTKGRTTMIALGKRSKSTKSLSALPPAILRYDDDVTSDFVEKSPTKPETRPKYSSTLEIASVFVEGQPYSSTDYARDCFAKEIITNKDRPVSSLIEAFFGSKDVSKNAVQKLKNHALYGKGDAGETRKAEIEDELMDCGRLNRAQFGAAKAIMIDNNPIVLVQGPPGSGKTSCIVACLVAWHSTRPDFIPNGDEEKWNDEAILCVAKTNVAVKNMAEKLERETNIDFRLVVSSEFYRDWHESQYTPIQKNIIITDKIRGFQQAKARFERELQPVHIYLCTLAQLSNETKTKLWLNGKRITHMIVDEASQIPLGEYLEPLSQLPYLKKIAFFGDDCQLPPYGSQLIPGGVPSVFSIKRFRNHAHFLDTQYRMPAVIANFISARVYQGYLRSDPTRPQLPAREGPELLWVDVNKGLGEALRGTSFDNRGEAEAITRCVQSLVHSPPFLSADEFVVLTGYDAQRKLMQDLLKEARLPYERNVYNVDTYQGHECHTVIVSLTRTANVGFLHDSRRTNVMLTRAKTRMIVFGRTSFAVGSKCRRTLVGALAMECRQRGIMIDEEVVGEPNWLTNPIRRRSSTSSSSSSHSSKILEEVSGEGNGSNENVYSRRKKAYRHLTTADESDSEDSGEESNSPETESLLQSTTSAAATVTDRATETYDLYFPSEATERLETETEESEGKDLDDCQEWFIDLTITSA